MATYGQIIRGVQHAEVALLTNDVPGAYTDIVWVKTFTLDLTSDSDEQTGDDATAAVVQENKALDITVVSAAANLAAAGVMTGSTPVTTGTAGQQVTTYEELAVANTRYVELRAVGRGRDATDSVARVSALKAQLTGGPNLDFGNGAWLEPELSFRGIARDNPLALYRYVAYENESSMT